MKRGKTELISAHQIHSANNSHSISQQMAARNLIKSPQMGEPGGADLAPIGALTSVAHDENAHFALGRFDGAVRFTGRDGVSLGVEEEMMDEGLHVFFHGGARRRRNFVVFDPDGAGRHFVQALIDDAEALSELFHAAEVAVVAVSVHPDRNVEFYLVVGVIWLGFPYVPGYTGPAKHDATE